MTKRKSLKSNIKYEIATNNYVGLLFFACVFASVLYIMKSQTPIFKEIEPTQKEILSTEVEITEINKITDEIKILTDYLNPGDINTFKIYQSNYVLEKVRNEDLNDENMLYIAYKYIEKNTDFSKYQSIITCSQAEKINLQGNIYQCGGNKYTNSYYMVNNYITKELLRKTVQQIFNRNISKFTNFYTSEDNLCYFINDEYLCVSHKIKKTNNYKIDFIKAYKYTNRITIMEKYKYTDQGTYYKGFNSSEVGEEYYISTFLKVNGKYYWSSTDVYKEN